MTERPLQPRKRNDFRIGIICALPLEAGMVRSIFDEENKHGFGKAQGDTNTYSIGVIGKHNVVLVHMPGMGSIDAATAAGCLRTSYPDIAIVFVVGICGASPQDNTTKKNIVLGDCIVSTAVVQYDFGRQYPGRFSAKSDVEDVLPRAGSMVRTFLAKLQTPQTSNSLERRLALHLEALQQKEPKASYPGAHRDRLFDATYIHTHYGTPTCDNCNRHIGVCTKECDEIGCQQERSIVRTAQHDPEAENLPKLHFGRYGSANTVLKSGSNRDELAKNKIIAFEMEGAGIWEKIPTLIVKSACDYADSHKSKEWQTYAAASAAAGLKAILEEWEMSDVLSSQTNNYNIEFSLDGVPLAKKFIERPVEKQKMEAVLLPNREASRKVFVLRGLGGIGKTQLAVEFMRKHRADFSATIWLDGGSKDSLKQSIVNFASRIPSGQISDKSRMYKISGDGEADTVVAEVMNWLKLSDNNRWLMVFDNVDREFVASDPDPLSYDIKQYIPDMDHGSILITTRLTQLERLGGSQEVKKVNDATAKAILNSWQDLSDNADSEELLRRLDGLPLAIAQAGSYLQQTGISISTYLRLYDEQDDRVTQAIHKLDILDDYRNRSVWTTWNISYEAVLAKDRYAANLLILWSYLDRNDLWFGIFERAFGRSMIAEDLLQRLGEIASKELSFIEAMSLLRNYSLIEGSPQGYTMHTVVHHWIYSYHGIKNRSDLGLLALKVVGRAVPMNYERDYAGLQRRLLPHANMCSIRVIVLEDTLHQSDDDIFGSQESQERFEDSMAAIHMLGKLYRDQGKLDESEKMYTRALQGSEALGSEHTLNTVNNLGNLYKDQGKLDEAEKMYTRALKGYEALGSERTLGTVNNLGNLYKEQGKLDEAEKMYILALKVYEEVLGLKHPSTLKTVGNLGTLYRHQGKLDEAEKMYTRALKGYEALGSEHTLDTVYNLGLLYKDQGKLHEAEKMYIRALKGYEEVLGSKHTSTLNTVTHLGLLYVHQGKLDEAEKMYIRALEGYEEVLGLKHISTLDTVNDLGLLYRGQGKLHEAEKMYIRALKGKVEALGSKHASTLGTVNDLGLLYVDQGKLDEAGKMYIRALEGYEEVLGLKHTSTLNTVGNLGILYMVQCKLDEAEKMHIRALEGYEEAIDPSLFKTYVPALNMMWNLGNLYLATRPDEARIMYERALAGYQKVQGASSDKCLYLNQQLEALKFIKPKKSSIGFRKLLRKIKG